MLSRTVRSLFFALGLLLGGGLLGCRAGSSERTGAVKVGYFANLTHAQAVLGVASGDFERAIAPATLEAKVFNAGPSLVEALFAGEIDIGYVGPGPALFAHERSGGKGIRVIAGAAANGVVVVARKGSGIRVLADLAGKRLGTPQLGNTQDISARHYLSAVLKEADLGNVTPIDNAEQAAMFARGALDAAWVPEPWGQRLIAETGATLVAEEKDLWPAKEFLLTLVVTTPEFLAKRPDVVQSILRAHRTWTRRLTDDPDTFLNPLGEALLALTGKRLAEGILPAALKRVRFVDDLSTDSLRTFASWKRDLGFDRGATDLGGLVDPGPLQRASAGH
ncbi:MAG TPA: aliphatic sulfonate ABC transporter substrate-binding protein [Polyangiaceae bacterium]|jgi:NitT/TauT family transport system substrate-binding protein|nr:aliphatic sulfonate ABC transporter substrate-binding protein [Polyangiaceae bacterium]